MSVLSLQLGELSLSCIESSAELDAMARDWNRCLAASPVDGVHLRHTLRQFQEGPDGVLDIFPRFQDSQGEKIGRTGDAVFLSDGRYPFLLG